MKTRAILLGCATVLLVAGSLWTGLRLEAQDPEEAPSSPEPALGILAASGHRTPAVAFLKALSQPLPGNRKRPKGAVSIFLPGPEQLSQYGNKAGLVTFLSNLPGGAANVQILVRDLARWEAVADDASALHFLRTLSRAGGAVDLLVTDVAGLPRFGARRSIHSFLKNLPAGSVIHLYTTPSEVVKLGSDAHLLSFIGVAPCAVEVHLDDPFTPVYLRAWEAKLK